MALFQKLMPFILIAGQILIFLNVESYSVKALMIAYAGYQVWKIVQKKNNAVKTD